MKSPPLSADRRINTGTGRNRNADQNLLQVPREDSISGPSRSKSREWGGRLPVALIFPEERSLALSTLGWQAVYMQLEEEGTFHVQRFFWDRKEGRAVNQDSDKKMSDFSLICFSLNFEGDYLNLVQALQACSMEVCSIDRADWPLVMAGGPVTFINPFPVMPSLDFIYTGETGEAFLATARTLSNCLQQGKDKGQALQAIAGSPGIFIAGQVQKVARQVQTSASRSLIKPAHSAFISGQSVFRNSFLVEINRGCPHGCRFCAAGFVYRPARNADMQELQELVSRVRPGKVGLMGTALTDWPSLREFLEWLKHEKIKFSLSSLRAHGLDRDFLEFLRKCGIRTITLAVEGISRALRSAVNKGFDQEKFYTAVEEISRLQFNTLKLYFILGLPGEKPQDLQELKIFFEELQQARFRGMGNRKKGIGLISISVSMFVPKPWTPLQWSGMISKKAYETRVKEFKKICSRHKGIRFTSENPFQARIQGLLARGDEKLHQLLILATANNGRWKKALEQWSGDMEYYTDRQIPLDETLPWDRLDIGVDKEYLLHEWDRYWKGIMTSPCPDTCCSNCRRCGMQRFSGGHNL